jgi:hypothetical protein
MKTFQSATVSRLGGAVASLILLTLFNLSWRAVAAPVTAKDAATAVANWLIVDPMPLGENLGGTVQQVDTFNDNSGNPIYYIVYLDPSAFVIVAADDLVEPIVGFARAGQYDPSEDNPLGALVSNDLSARVAYAQRAGDNAQSAHLRVGRAGGAVHADDLGPANRRRRRHRRLLQLLHAALRGRKHQQLPGGLRGDGHVATHALLSVPNHQHRDGIVFDTSR